MKTTKTIKDMASIIKEYKEYQEIQNQLKAQMEALRAEAIEILSEESIDEYVCDEGKITYREVISKRCDTTQFKKSCIC